MDTLSQACAGVIAGIIGTPCDAYTSSTAHDLIVIPNAAVWVSQTVTLAYVQIDTPSHGIPTMVTLSTSIGDIPSDSSEDEPYSRLARRILSALQSVLLDA